MVAELGTGPNGAMRGATTRARAKTLGSVRAHRATSQRIRAVSEQPRLHKAEYGHVSIKFAVSKVVEFGSRLMIVGSTDNLGQWDAGQALALEWSDGHVWQGEIDVPLSDLLNPTATATATATDDPDASGVVRNQTALEYKYVIQSKDGAVHWMEGENLHIPAIEYGTKALIVQDSWGFGYREIQFERLAEESLLELLKQEEKSTRNALGSMVDQAMRDLANTLLYCEGVSQRAQRTDGNVLNADRELAAAATRATQILRANEALFYLDSV